MKRLILTLAFCTALAPTLSPVLAQAQTATEGDTEILALTETYINLPGVQSLMTNMFSAETMGEQFANSLPPQFSLSDSQQQRVGALLSGEMSAMRPLLEEQMRSAIAETFSVDELNALIAFYSSEHGASVMEKMPNMMTGVMAQLAPQITAMQTRIQPELMNILTEE